jgi:hypothetical protein
MAKHWYIDSTASKDQVVAAFREVLFTRPTVAERLKFWSKAAQFPSNLRWGAGAAEGADVAAELVSGGIREAVQSSKHGGGSILGTVLAMSVDDAHGDAVQAQLWLASYNTFFGINQQSDIIKSYAKQIARNLQARGASANVHR